MLITSEGFIEVQITDEMTQRATAKAQEMGELRNSIRRGRGNLAGFLGEEIVLDAFGGSVSNNTFQHDIEFDGTTFEVKTKDRTVMPSLSYEASVANYNPNQRADFYVFTSLLRNKADNRYVKGYVLGIISKADYFQRANFLRVGDIDPSNGWVVSADCYNVSYATLTRFETWRDAAAA